MAWSGAMRDTDSYGRSKNAPSPYYESLSETELSRIETVTMGM